MVFRMQLACHEIAETLNTKYIDAKSTGYTLPPGIYEISHININLMLKSLLSDEKKVDKKIDDIRFGSNLTTNKTISFTKKSIFLYHIRISSMSLRHISG